MQLLQTLGFTPILSASSSYIDKRLAVCGSKGQRMGLFSPILSYPFRLPCNGWNSSKSRDINHLELDCSKMGKRFAVCGSKGEQMGGNGFTFDEKELASEESLWNLYERWCSHFGISRDADEKGKRFNVFKETAKRVCEHNKKKDVSYTQGLNDFSDTRFEERMMDLSPDVYPVVDLSRYINPDDQ